MSFFLTIKDFHLPKFWPFLLNHPVYIYYSNSSISKTAHNQTPVLMNIFLTVKDFRLPKYVPFHLIHLVYTLTLADSRLIIYCLFCWSWSDHIAVCRSSSDRISSSILESHWRPLYRFIDWLSTCFIAPVIPSAVWQPRVLADADSQTVRASDIEHYMTVRIMLN